MGHRANIAPAGWKLELTQKKTEAFQSRPRPVQVPQSIRHTFTPAIFPWFNWSLNECGAPGQTRTGDLRISLRCSIVVSVTISTFLLSYGREPEN